MHLPNERVYKEIQSEPGGLWYVPATGYKETAILLKAPSNTLKAVASSCKIELLFGLYIKRDIEYLCTGIRIYDTTDTPLLLFSLQCHGEEQLALKNILTLNNSPIFLFNELDMCVASGELKISNNEAKNGLSLLNGCKNLYAGAFNKYFNQILDDFHISIDPTILKETQIKSTSLSVNTCNWDSHIINFVGYSGSSETSLNDVDEGRYFENKVWFSLDDLFKTNLHKSPQVIIGRKTRELTDILAYSKEKLFLIEAKSLSVIKAGFNRSQDRKSKGVIGQVNKAIKQLAGAFKALENDIFDKKSTQKILIPNKVKPHCIALVSELVEFGEWKNTVSKILELTSKENYYIHVIDLREWINLLKFSSGDPVAMDENLKARFKVFIETSSLHLRAKNSNKSNHIDP